MSNGNRVEGRISVPLGNRTLVQSIDCMFRLQDRQLTVTLDDKAAISKPTLRQTGGNLVAWFGRTQPDDRLAMIWIDKYDASDIMDAVLDSWQRGERGMSTSVTRPISGYQLN